MSARANAMKNLYIRGKITNEGLKQAVIYFVITKEEYLQITGEAY